MTRKPPHDGSEPPSRRASADRVSIRVSRDTCEAQIGTRVVTLTPTERKLLETLVERRNEVVTRTTLTMAAWGKTGVEWIRMLDNEISGLKIAVGEQVTIETIPGIGYRLH